jgi:hypothetical protein
VEDYLRELPSLIDEAIRATSFNPASNDNSDLQNVPDPSMADIEFLKSKALKLRKEAETVKGIVYFHLPSE